MCIGGTLRESRKDCASGGVVRVGSLEGNIETPDCRVVAFCSQKLLIVIAIDSGNVTQNREKKRGHYKAQRNHLSGFLGACSMGSVADIIIRQYDARLLRIGLPLRDKGLQAFRLLLGQVHLLPGIVRQIV